MVALTRDHAWHDVADVHSWSIIDVAADVNEIPIAAFVQLTAGGYVVMVGDTGGLGVGPVAGVNRYNVPDQTGAANGDAQSRVYVGLFDRPLATSLPPTDADMFKAVYAANNFDVTSDSGQPLLGVMVGINNDAGTCTVLIGVGNLTLSTDAGLANRIAAFFADTTAQTAMLPADRADGMLAMVVDDDAGVHADGGLWLFFAGAAGGASDYTRVPDAGDGRWIRLIPMLAELAATSNSIGASLIGIENAAGDLVAADVEAALAELAAHGTSDKGRIPLPLGGFVDVAGTQLTTFVGGASDQPGIELTDVKARSIRWNDHAAPLAVMSSFQIPQDADVSVDMELQVVCSRTGTTDFTTVTAALFNQVIGGLHDDDVDYGGVTTALTAGASKTVRELTLAMLAVNLPAAGSNVTLTIKPTAGTLGTDDFHLLAIRVAYTRLITS